MSLLPPKPASAEPPARHSIQMSRAAYERLSRIATDSGLSRSQIIEFLVETGTLREHLQALRQAGLRPRLTGRKKQSVFGD